MVLLESSDSERFNVDKDVAERSVLIKQMLDDLGDTENPIPLPNVTSNVLKKVSSIQIRSTQGGHRDRGANT